MSQKSEFVTAYRQQTAQLLNTLDRLQSLKNQFDVLNYATALTDQDGADGDNSVTAAQVVAAVNAVTALRDLIAANPTEAAKLYLIAR